MNWKEKLKEILEEHDGVFGHNCHFDIKKYLRKIEKLSSNHCAINVIDYYTIEITLSPDYFDYQNREDVLLHILTTQPIPSECKYNKKKEKLTLEWHY